MEIKTWVRDLVEDEYLVKCKLTDDETNEIVKQAEFDKQLNYEIEQAILRYIREFLWDIGKPDEFTKEIADDLKGSYVNWVDVGSGKWTFVESKLKGRGIEEQRFYASVLRGRDCGELREHRLGKGV